MAKRFFLKIFVLGVILWSIFYALDYLMTKKALEDKCRRSNWVFSFKNQHFDFVFAGDSRVYNMIDIPTIHNVTGKKGLNIGYSGTIFEEQLLIIRKFIENGNRIDKLFLQADILSFNSARRSRHQFRFYNYVAYLRIDNLVSSVIENNVNQFHFACWKYVPYFRFVEYNLEYPISILFKDFSSCSTEFDSYGTKLFRGVSPKFNRNADEYIQTPRLDTLDANLFPFDTTGMVASKTMNHFKQIIRFCKQKQIEVVLYTPPIFSSTSSGIQNRVNYINFINQIAIENNVEYLTFLNDSLCLDKDNFFDSAHMNALGTKKFSNVMSAYIK